MNLTQGKRRYYIQNIHNIPYTLQDLLAHFIDILNFTHVTLFAIHAKKLTKGIQKFVNERRGERPILENILNV